VVAPYFSTTLEGQIAHGRGVADMRAAIVNGVLALRNLGERAARGEKIPRFALWLTGDEEIGGENGTKALVQEDGYRANTIINFDGGTPGELTTRAKGIQKVTKVVVPGIPAHGAYPWLAMDPNGVLEDALGITFEEAVGSGRNEGTTFTITNRNSGHASNSSPREVVAGVDCRFSDPILNDSERIRNIIWERLRRQYVKRSEVLQRLRIQQGISEDQRRHIDEMLQQIPQLIEGIEVHLGSHSDVFQIPMNSDEFLRWDRIATKVMGRPIQKVVDMGGNDSEYVIGARHQILTAVPTARRLHKDDESVGLKGMLQMQQILDEFLNEVS